MRKAWTILLAIFSIFQTVKAQSWRISQLTVADGLSQGYIYTIHQDKKGFIWIGTHGGLNRYDGYGFKVFQYMPFDSSSLGDNSVFFLKEDPSTGKFWIGGSSCLNEFDPQTFKNTRYRYHDKQLEFADGIFVNANEILLACEYDVLMFDTKTKKLSKIPVYDEHNRQVTVSRVENVAADRRGNFMIMSKTGVYFYDPTSRACRRKTAGTPDFSRFYQHEVFNVLHDSNGDYWFATNKKGLIRYRPATGSTTTIALPPGLDIHSLRFDVVTEDSRGIIWAGSSNGLFRINKETLQVEYFPANGDRKKPALGHPEVNVIMEDRNQYMWVGTVGGGVNKLIPQNAGFKNLLLADDHDGVTTGTYIMGLQQKDDDIWFINIWDQVGRVNWKTGKTNILSREVLPRAYSWYSEGTLGIDPAGNILLLNGENAYRIQEKGSKFEIGPMNNAGIMHIHRSPSGRNYYMVKASVKETFLRNDTIYGNHFFYDSKEDPQGNTWVGTSKGLMKVSAGSNGIQFFSHEDGDRSSISSDFIYAMELDNKNEYLWMAAYHGGLCSYHLATGRFRHYTKEDGLPDNIVYSIEKDLRGNLWFTTNAGITTYNLNTKVFTSYGKADGLLNNEYNRRSSFRNQEGWIFFGGILGIDYFHPDSIVKKSSVPGLAFTGFKVGNNDIIPEGNSGQPMIDVTHRNRYISIDFSALEYNDQQKIQYAYRLNDNKEWIMLGNQHSILFTDWKPGTHTLHIRSTSLEGIWMDNAIACTIIIHPPWWQTWWFRVLAVAAALALVVLMIRSYYRRKLQKQQMIYERQTAIDRERTRIAMEMHDDLGSGLTSIRYLASGLAGGSTTSNEKAAKIASSAKELVDNMNDIIWTMKSDNNTLEEVLAYIRKQTAEQLENASMESSFHFPKAIPDITLTNEQKRNLLLISKEAIHNVVKHAKATEVKLKTDIVDDMLELVVADNGKGIDMAVTEGNGNGLKNMRRRAEEMGGTLEIQKEKGTVVTLKTRIAHWKKS